jgi:serine/threonine protein kinase/DNA-binding SARP family transcriptional activator
MSSLSLNLLGSFGAFLDYKSIDELRSNRVQALLIYLAVERSELSRREFLCTLLWPGMPEKSARHNLSQTLYALRQIFPEVPALAHDDTVPLLLADRQTVQLNPAAQVKVDLHQLDDLLKKTRLHDHFDLTECDACIQSLEGAVALYRDDFLADFYLEDSNQFEEWAQAIREDFRRKVLEVLNILTSIAINQKAYEEAHSYAQRQLEIDNLRESAYRQLMEILALSDQRVKAIALYETCRRLLAEELGMEPAVSTTELYETIRAGKKSVEDADERSIRGYDLKEEIGTGAYGVIRRAIQTTVGREVAIKIINPQFANDPAFIRRFEAEAQTISRLEHPHIVPLYDFWREPGSAYIVMRLLRGGNLQKKLENGSQTLEKVQAFLDQIAPALHNAHRHGIVHRDIKPANILFDETGNAYLSDFGIAKDLRKTGYLTLAGGIQGTIDYISPEQLEEGSVSPQSDIYSLGAVLYEMITGKKPFPEANLLELLQSQLTAPFPLISSSIADIPEQIDAVVQRATAKTPVNRYADVLEMAEAFRLAIQGQYPQTVSARPILDASEITNPYKGLRAFREADAMDFYGREELVTQLINRLAENRFLAVVGPSGSGKSSAVKAGLIPALRKGALPGSENWFVAVMMPGEYPLEELELALWRCR